MLYTRDFCRIECPVFASAISGNRLDELDDSILCQIFIISKSIVVGVCARILWGRLAGI